MSDAIQERFNRPGFYSETASAVGPIVSQAIVRQLLDEILVPFSVALRATESPLEAAFLAALAVQGVFYAPVRYRVGGHDMVQGASESADFLLIEPQAQLGEHRVDLLLTYRASAPDFDKPKRLPNGEELPGVRVIERKMVIECDGHDYHERTKEQAAKDRSRDRQLQSFGYLVFRYTGAEVWADVFGCVRQALDQLARDAERTAWRSDDQ